MDIFFFQIRETKLYQNVFLSFFQLSKVDLLHISEKYLEECDQSTTILEQVCIYIFSFFFPSKILALYNKVVSFYLKVSPFYFKFGGLLKN